VELLETEDEDVEELDTLLELVEELEIEELDDETEILLEEEEEEDSEIDDEDVVKAKATIAHA